MQFCSVLNELRSLHTLQHGESYPAMHRHASIRKIHHHLAMTPTQSSSHALGLYTNGRQLFLFKARISACPIQRLQCQRHTPPPACPTSPPASSSGTHWPRTSTPSRPPHPLATPGGQRPAPSPPAHKRSSSSASLSRSWSAPPHTPPKKETSKLTSVFLAVGKPEDPQAVHAAPRAGLPRHARLTAGRAHPAALPKPASLPAQPPMVRAPGQAVPGPRRRRLRAHHHAPPAPRRLRQEEVSARQPARSSL